MAPLSEQYALILLMALTAIWCSSPVAIPNEAIEASSRLPLEQYEVSLALSSGPQLGSRRFNSRLPLRVTLLQPNGIAYVVGTTPAITDLVLPESLCWYVTPYEVVSAVDLLSEVTAQAIPGVAIGRAELLDAESGAYSFGLHNLEGSIESIGAASELRWLEFAGPLKDEEASAISCLRNLKALDLSGAEVSPTALRLLCEAPGLSLLRLPGEAVPVKVNKGVLALDRNGITENQAFELPPELRFLRASNIQFADGEESHDQFADGEENHDGEGDQCVFRFRKLTALRALRYDGAGCLWGISACKELKALNVAHHRFTTRELRDIADLPELRSLALEATGLGGADLAVMRGAHALRILRIVNTDLLTELRVDQITEISRLTQLEELNLVAPAKADLSPLARLVALRDLRVSCRTDLSPAAAKSIAALPRLRKLSLNGVRLTEPTVQTLVRGLTILEELSLEDCGQTSIQLRSWVASNRPTLRFVAKQRVP